MSDDDCITIDSEEEESQDREPKSAVKPEHEQSKYLKNGKKYAHIRSIDGADVYEQFLDKCKTAIRPVADAEKGIRKMRRLFAKADPSYKNQTSFVNLLQMTFPKVAEEPWQCMKKVADELKLHSIRKPLREDPVDAPESFPDDQNSELDRKTRRQIAKLKLLLARVHSKIRFLEEQEVNFDGSDDENSNYLKVARYKRRFCEVHKKICEMERAGDDDISKAIRFSGTKFPAVNRALERFYNDKKEFPDYPDILRVVKVVNDRRQLNLTELQIHDTAKVAFEELGQTLKLQRQYDFHDTMCSYLPDHQADPAAADDQLQEKLSENQRLHGHKIDEIINKYATKQEENHLEAVEVASGEEEQTSENEEEEENDDNEVTSASEYEMDQSEDELQVRPCTVRLPDITMSPIWKRYGPKAPKIMKIEPDFQQPCCSKSLVTQRRERAECDSSDSEIYDRKRSKVEISSKIVTSTPLSNFAGEIDRDTDNSDSKNVLGCLNLENIENIIVPGEQCSTESSPASRKSENDEVEENFSSKTVTDEVNSDTVKNFDSVVVTVSEPKFSSSEVNRKFAGSNFKAELNTSVCNKIVEKTKKDVPNGVVSPIRKTDQDPKLNTDDDDVVIIDEIPSKSKPKVESRCNEIIDVDKLGNASSVRQGTFSTIDLGAFIKKINFSLPNGTNVTTGPRKPNALPCRPAQTSIITVPRPSIPNVPPIRRMMIPPNYRASSLAQTHHRIPSTNYMRPSLIQNRNAFVNQSSQRRFVQSNEVRRFVQNNQIIARRKTTTVEESIVQVSAARSSQVPNQGFSRAFRNNAFSSSLQTTRKLVQVNHTTQLREVKKSSTQELIQLD